MFQCQLSSTMYRICKTKSLDIKIIIHIINQCTVSIITTKFKKDKLMRKSCCNNEAYSQKNVCNTVIFIFKFSFLFSNSENTVQFLTSYSLYLVLRWLLSYSQCSLITSTHTYMQWFNSRTFVSRVPSLFVNRDTEKQSPNKSINHRHTY